MQAGGKNSVKIDLAVGANLVTDSLNGLVAWKQALIPFFDLVRLVVLSPFYERTGSTRAENISYMGGRLQTQGTTLVTSYIHTWGINRRRRTK